MKRNQIDLTTIDSNRSNSRVNWILYVANGNWIQKHDVYMHANCIKMLNLISSNVYIEWNKVNKEGDGNSSLLRVDSFGYILGFSESILIVTPPFIIRLDIAPHCTVIMINRYPRLELMMRLRMIILIIIMREWQWLIRPLIGKVVPFRQYITEYTRFAT